MMYLSIFALFVSITCRQVAAVNINDGNYQKVALDTHNSDRAKHGVPALQWDPKLAQFAHNWANNCEFKHSGGPYGENLHGLWTTSKMDYSKSIQSGIHNGWYMEIQKYDYNKPGFSMATGHFTQVVWKSSKRIGCAWNTNACKSNGVNFYNLVCEYDPPGNYANKFKENVPRPVKAMDVNPEGSDDGLSMFDEDAYKVEDLDQSIIKIPQATEGESTDIEIEEL